MRGILIIAVLIVTLMTFYSALWYKTEAIEQDITARVTDELENSGAKAVDIGVDGRHVTLTGIVYDEAAEQAYLQTADETYGALGPIDGLTYSETGGYLVAEKTADGIVLRGVVSDEAARAALIAQAEGATDGAVEDQLAVGGAPGDWQQEAEFGVSQLAALTVGTVTAASGAYALSGTTQNDADALEATLAERADWNAFVHSPNAQSDLSDQISRLTGDLAAKDGEVSTLNTTLTDLRAEVAQTQALVSERDATIGELNGKVVELETELNARQATLGSTDEQVEALRAQLADRFAELGGANQTIAGLNDEVANLTERSAEATSQAEGLTARIGELEAELAARQDALGSTDAEVLALQTQLSEASAQSDALSAQNSALTDRVAELEGEVETLQAELLGQRNAFELQSQRTEDLTAGLTERDGQIASLTGQLQDSEAAKADVETQLAALTAASVASQARVSELNGLVEQREATIAALRSANPGSSVIEQCTEQASAVIENAQINFATGTASIDAASVGVLERLTGIALACAGETVTVEIGGHTDDRGSDDANQALSEARAQAIVAFMVERGVPQSGLRAVGFGESQPIADNETNEGRAANRRISFDWQAR